MDMVARAMALIEVAVAAKMKQIELVNQAVSFQQVNGAVHGHTCDIRIYLLSAIEYFASIQMPLRFFHHLQEHAALARQTDSARGQFALKMPRRLMNIDAFTS